MEVREEGEEERKEVSRQEESNNNYIPISQTLKLS